MSKNKEKPSLKGPYIFKESESLEEQPRPEPVEAHRCPKCKMKKIGSFEEAQRPVDTEVDTPLPKGLIYFDQSIGGWMRVILDDGIINSKHNYTHRTLRSCYYNYEDGEIDSREFKEGLRKGTYSLAKPEKMNYYNLSCYNILGMIHAKEFVRTTPELEKIVAQESAA